jgi:hypothetical protein
LKDGHDAGHPGIHPLARPPPEHRDQVGQCREGRSRAGDEADDLGALKPRREQAAGIVHDQVRTTAEHDPA